MGPRRHRSLHAGRHPPRLQWRDIPQVSWIACAHYAAAVPACGALVTSVLHLLFPAEVSTILSHCPGCWRPHARLPRASTCTPSRRWRWRRERPPAAGRLTRECAVIVSRKAASAVFLSLLRTSTVQRLLRLHPCSMQIFSCTIMFASVHSMLQLAVQSNSISCLRAGTCGSSKLRDSAACRALQPRSWMTACVMCCAPTSCRPQSGSRSATCSLPPRME